MKGTLFSADFIEDSNGDLRLLELNTDTAVTDNGLAYINFNGLVDIISTNSISEVHVISKEFHKNLVSLLSQSLHDSAVSISVFQNIVEEPNSIYPTSVEDSSDKFILRMAYDESAIFDSEYTKNKLGPLSLFTNSGDSGSVAEYYISSSDEGIFDFLPSEFNSSNMPDIAVKNLQIDVNNPIDFYKIGKSSDTDSDRYTELKSYFDSDKLVLKFYENPSDSKVKSIRSLNIIYGGNLDIINLGNFIGEGLFEKPTSIEYDDSLIANKINVKHYYELTTSFPRFNTIENWGGIFEEEEIVKADGSTVLIASASVGDEFKSYFISGSPNTDVVAEFMEWSYPGSELPSGSFETSSILLNNIEQSITYNLVVHVTMEDSSSFRAAGGAHMLVYDSNEERIKYEDTYNLDANRYKLINLSGGVVDISSVVFEVLDGTYSTHILDMESTDTYFLSEGGLNVKIVTHNCFPAGTKITLADGSQKNIEDLTTEDKLLTWNENTGDLVEGSIGNIIKKSDNLLIHLITEEGEIKSTPLHKFYVKGKQWTLAQDIVIGDVLLNSDNNEVIVTDRNDILGSVEVYHILDVTPNHNYFAENILVHNKVPAPCFVAGTEITLANGDVKNIEDVVVDEEVLTYNEVSGEQEIGVVGKLKHHEVTSVIRLTLDNETIIITTHEHPFFVEDKGWVKAGELQPLDVCKKVDGSESLISTVEVLEETHIVYNLLSVSENHNFYANGILVHNKL